MPHQPHSRARVAASLLRRGHGAVPAALVVAIALLTVRAAWPAPAHAVDLFPVDDWLSDGIKKAGDVVLGGLELSAKAIAQLIATVVGALADLLVPKSLVNAGLDGIRWLVSLPAVGPAATPTAAGGYSLSVRMPHVVELRHTLTWIGITLLPVGVILAGGRAILAPSLSGEGPTDILIRVIGAGVALIAYDLIWTWMTRLSGLIVTALLELPWVDDGIEKMLETLLIGGAAGTAVASEFVIPLLMSVAGGALLALLLLRVGLEVATALLYVLGGLVLGLSPTDFGRRLLLGWSFAVTGILVLPVLWTIVFVTGAALMLDAGAGPGGGFGKFIAQLFNVAAAAAVFLIAIKLGRNVFSKVQSSIASLGSMPGSGSSPSSPSASQGTGAGGNGAPPAGVPASLAAFSRNLRAGVGAAARTAASAAGHPVRHPVAAAHAAGHAARHPIQSTQHTAGRLRDAIRDHRRPQPAATSPAAADAPSKTRPFTPTATATARPSAARAGSRTGAGAQATARPPERSGATPAPAEPAPHPNARRSAPAAPAVATNSPGTKPSPAPPRETAGRRAAARKSPSPRGRSTSSPPGPAASIAMAAIRHATGAPADGRPVSGVPGARPAARTSGTPRPTTAPPARSKRRRPATPKKQGSKR